MCHYGRKSSNYNQSGDNNNKKIATTLIISAQRTKAEEDLEGVATAEIP